MYVQIKGVRKISTNNNQDLPKRFEIRLDEQTAKDLIYCSQELKITKTEVIKTGIKKVKSGLEKK